VAEVRRLLLDHLQDHYQLYGEGTGVRSARKHIAWYTRGLRGSNEFRQAMYALESTSTQRQAVAQYFAQLAASSERLEYVSTGPHEDEDATACAGD